MKSIMIGVRIPTELRERLEKIAEASGQKLSDVVRLALENLAYGENQSAEYTQALEDLRDLLDAAERARASAGSLIQPVAAK